MPISNVEELRTVMSLELDKLRSKEVSASGANAAANLAGKIISSVRLEMEYNKMVGATPHISFLNVKEKDGDPLKIENKKENGYD